MKRLFQLVKRPSVWTALIALGAYWDQGALKGKWVYDDAGSVAKNVVVNGHVPWKEAFTRDFWGTPMNEPQSHKSFRPITTLTFKWNWLLSDFMGTIDNMDETTYYFHIVNVVLHAMNTGLVTEAAAFVFDDPLALGTTEGDVLAQLITGFVFGLHPVHCEAVSNVTSRGELLMTLFFLLAFLAYASHIPTRQQFQYNTETNNNNNNNNNNNYQTIGSRIQYIVCVYVIPWLCMALSLFSKEQGATTLCTLVAYDFLKHHLSVKEFLIDKVLHQRDWYSLLFLGRTVILAIQTLLLVALRYWLNGESSPDFIYDQNPAGFSKDRFTRVFSICWVYCLYIRDALWPYVLSPDWSGKSIDLITDISDPRALLVIFLWIFAFACLQSLLQGLPDHATRQELEVRRVLLMAFFAFLFLPFLLSSNLLVVVGLMKADRVIYLPLLGFCIMEALLVKTLCCTADKQDEDGMSSIQEAKQGTNVKADSIMTAQSQEATAKTSDDDTTKWEEIAATSSNAGSKLENNVKTTTKPEQPVPSNNSKDCNVPQSTLSPPIIQPRQHKQGQLHQRLRVNWLGHLLVILQLGMFAVKLHERNIAWSSPELLWISAFNINPRSHHTMYNCGYELSLRQRYEEAEQVMRPIGNARVDGPSNTFVYAMVLYNLNRCDEANEYIDIAMEVLEEQRREGGVRYQPSSLDRTKSNLLVARGYCTMDDFKKQGRILQEAVRTDPRNTYAVQQFQAYLNKMEQIRELKEKYGMDVNI